MNIETITEQALKMHRLEELILPKYCWKVWIMQKTLLFQKTGGKKYKSAVKK